ncbi:MAG: ABC transporter permease [Luteolibacter sp.]|uniref:ABC transporter permease n=1 Tax=Luteolibacter sp. TaxID=1962973 RepID=UPI003266351F
MYSPIPIPKHSPWVTQVLVIRALLKREMSTRFGEYRLGFFWMLFEPLLGVLVIGVLIGTLAERTVPEIPYPFFLLNGMLLMRLLTGPMNMGINAIGSNTGLLVYPAVRPLDTFIARFLFELLTTLFSYTLFCILGMFFGIFVSLGHLEIVLACHFLTWCIGCGLGLIFGVASAHFNEVDKVVMILQRPLLFISAVLFPISAASSSVQQILLYNPLVHTIELSRNALFPYYNPGEATLVYPATVAIVVLSVGLTLFHGNRNFLSQR